MRPSASATAEPPIAGDLAGDEDAGDIGRHRRCALHEPGAREMVVSQARSRSSRQVRYSAESRIRSRFRPLRWFARFRIWHATARSTFAMTAAFDLILAERSHDLVSVDRRHAGAAQVAPVVQSFGKARPLSPKGRSVRQPLRRLRRLHESGNRRPRRATEIALRATGKAPRRQAGCGCRA